MRKKKEARTLAQRQADLRKRRKKRGYVQLTVYVSRKTRAIVNKSADIDGKTQSEWVEFACLKAALGDNVTSNTITSNKKKPVKSRKKPKAPARFRLS